MSFCNPRRDLFKWSLLGALSGAFFLVFALGTAAAAQKADVELELIVKFRRADSQIQRRLPRERGVSRVKPMKTNKQVHLVRARSRQDLLELKKALAADSQVEYVEENQVVRAQFVPNDPSYKYQWGFRQIKAEQAWDLMPMGGRGVTVAVLDTGIAYEDYSDHYGTYHRIPDLQGVSFAPGWDFVHDDAHPNDDNGHGTHVAGTIAQATNNNYGVAGLAYGARLMPVKVLAANGTGDIIDIAEGIRWAAKNGAKVINLSLGHSQPSRTVEEALKYARQTKKATIVAAAGNTADVYGYGGGLLYPAAYDLTIAVGAVRFDKKRTGYSQYGRSLDIMAPGGDMGVDQNGDGYGDGIVQETIKMSDIPGLPGDPTKHGLYWYDGTSQAAAHVSGAAALLIARGMSSPNDVFRALTRTAVDAGQSGHDPYYGYGLLDVAGALRYKALPTVWYLAEGYTADRFNTKIFIGNHNAKSARIRATFSKPGGSKVVKSYVVDPTSRYTIDVDRIPGLRSTGVSAKLEATNGVGFVVERSLFFNYKGRRGGHSSLGSRTTGLNWYFAEGCTRPGFETQLLLYNPNGSPAAVRAVFTKVNGGRVSADYTIPAWGRRKIIVNNIAGLRDAEFATKVSSLNGRRIVAERSVYFKHNGIDGGHNAVGVTAPAVKWLFAEGATHGPFETWILAQNPSTTRNADVRAVFSKPDGTQVARRYSIKPGRRLTISVDAIPGLRSSPVAAQVQSLNKVGIVAERAMYFNYQGRAGGHVTFGAKKSSTDWYTAAGYTGGGFETWLLIYNPTKRTAAVSFRFSRPTGPVVSYPLAVPGRSRANLAVDAVPGLSSAQVSARVHSVNGVPLIVERSSYFGYGAWDGGDVSMGLDL